MTCFTLQFSRCRLNCSVKSRHAPRGAAWTMAKTLRKTRGHSESYFLKAREKIYERLAQLPRGTIKERLISGWKYYYLQRREGKKVLHTYIGREIPEDLKRTMQERETLRAELRKIQKSLVAFLSAEIKKIMQ